MKPKLFDRLLIQVRRQIRSCLNCQPADEGKPYWAYDQEICIDELFDRCDVPDLMRAQMVRYLKCPTCQKYFEQYDSVGIEIEQLQRQDDQNQEAA
jgi:hypothetical protein